MAMAFRRALETDDVQSVAALVAERPTLLEHPVSSVDLGVCPAPPIVFAAGCGATACVHFLVTRGADINARDPEGRTALLKASALPYGCETIRALLELGAVTNVADDYGFTPLSLASTYKRAASQRLLANYWSPRHLPACKGLVTMKVSLRGRLLTADLCMRRLGLPGDVRLVVMRCVVAVEDF